MKPYDQLPPDRSGEPIPPDPSMDSEEFPDPDGEPVAVEPTDSNWARNIVLGAFRVVGYGSIGVVALGLITPVTCAGAQSSARLEWLQREQRIEEAIHGQTNTPPTQP